MTANTLVEAEKTVVETRKVAPSNPTPLPPGDWGETRDGMVQRARAGDRTAYAELVRRFRSVVFGLAMSRLGNAAEAEEVAQEVFVHSMAKLGQLRDPRCFAGWLRQITLRFALSRRLRRGTGPKSAAPLREDVAAPHNDPLDRLIRAEEQGRLRQVLRQLRPLDRAMLEAFYLRSQSLRQMSEEFKVPIGTIKRRLHMARHRLRRRLDLLAGAAGLP